jgi:large subunit ribosomal protein L15
MPLQRRIPKRGFNNPGRIEFAIINLSDIEGMQGLDVISPDILIERGIIRQMKDGLKVLANGKITRPITVRADAFSATAAEKITAAGGKAEVI